ncbi:MAG: hypothetical protein ACLPH5_16290 [Candidatus Sulfotelmatobacter sp.]
MTGLDGAANDVVMSRFGRQAFDAGGIHEGIPMALAGTAQTDYL